MKTLFCALFASMIAGTAAHAAVADHHELNGSVGVIAGANFSKLHAADNAGNSGSSETNTGFIGGVYGQTHLVDGLYLEAQLRYIERGGSSTGLDGTTTYLSPKYLQIPVYAKYKFNNDSGIIPFVFGGPAFGLKVGNSATAKDANGNTIVSSNTQDGIKGFEFSLDAGVGAEYAIGSNLVVSVNAAYSWGLTSIVDADLNGASVKNRGFQTYAGLGWYF